MIPVEETVRSTAAAHVESIKDVLDNKWSTIVNASFETGLLGLSLFYSYYAIYTDHTRYFEKAEEFLLKGISSFDLSKFQRIHKTDSLDAHLAHIGRFIEFSKANRLLEMDTGDYLSDIDNTLLGLMKSKISTGNFDLNCGALASGYYYLSRTEHTHLINGHLTALVHGMEEMAFKDADGDYYWETPPLLNRVYLGISHGSASIISFLTNVYERGTAQDSCRRILSKAANFLRKQKHDYGRGLFPNYIGDSDTGPKQFSLCYGDLGIGYALYRAGIVLQEEHLLTEATIILEDCLTRKREDNLTLDASILYGASGLAAAFEKIYTINNDQRYLDAAGYWYLQIPAYAVHKNEFAGYKTRLVHASDLWNTSFGWGVIGIGVSLMRFMKPELPPIGPLLYIA